MNSPVNTFLLEAEDLVQNLEAALLELDESPHAAEPIDTAFRALHTLKGSGNMFGFTALGSFIHHFEEVFEMIRKGSVRVTPDLVELALDSRDHISALITLGPNADLTEDLATTDATLLDRLHKIVELPSAGNSAPSAKGLAKEPVSTGLRLWEIHFKAEPNALGIGFRPDLLFEDLSQLGHLTVEAQTTAVPGIQELESGECYLTWKLLLQTNASKSEIEDIFIFQLDAEISIEEKSNPFALVTKKTDAAKGDITEKSAVSACKPVDWMI
jgi:two-component system, chemotaxis family, sensor kinase CheA